MPFYDLTLRACGRGLWRPILRRSSDFGGDLKTYIHIPDSWGFHRYIQIRGAKKQSENLYVIEQVNGGRKHSLQLTMTIASRRQVFYYDLN